MGAAEVGELPLVEVDDGPLEVVGAVVEEEQHGGADELGPELGEGARVDRLEEDLQALDRLVHVRAERRHPQPEEAGELAEEGGDRLLLLDGGDAGGVADGGLRREVGAVVAEVLLHQRQHHLEEKLDRLLRLLVARTPAGERFNSVKILPEMVADQFA